MLFRDSKEEPLEGKYMGLVRYTKRTIFLSREIGLEAIQQTLLHEVAHALLYMSGVGCVLTDEQTEAVCDCLGNGFRGMVFGGK